jgi:hypothetical protein
MKRKVFLFVCMALLVLSVVPLINFKLETEKQAYKSWSRSMLYSLEFALPYLSHFFYPFGISTDPNQVIIGKNGWLYLGDKYARTMTVARRGANIKDVEASKKIGFSTKSWEQWLKHKGVSLFQIMLGPDKSTVYPEFLPDWVQPVTYSATDTLLANVSQGLYVDTRPFLIKAKTQFLEPLYYKTDTHWNSLGAWVAFRTFTKDVDRKGVRLLWLSDQQVRISTVKERKGGDLAKFLRMTEMLQDSEVVMEIDSKHPIETKQYDFETENLILSGGNPLIQAPKRPLLVKSEHALNQKKVLWLRDSFGSAMAPFMAATFTETLQIHYDEATPVLFARLVNAYKPDYVFITVVERGSRGEWFENIPPQTIVAQYK